jgi:cell division protein FtsB
MIKLLQNPLIVFLFTIITIVFYISLSKTQQKTLSTTQKIESIQEEKEQLTRETKILEDKLQNTNTEEMIRNEFLMQKNGEYVVKVPSLPTESEDNKDNKEESNLNKWKKVLFN